MTVVDWNDCLGVDDACCHCDGGDIREDVVLSYIAHMLYQSYNIAMWCFGRVQKSGGRM